MGYIRNSNARKLFILSIVLTFSTLINAQNVILFISDGCGYNHVKAASFYQYGEEGKQIYQKFPVQYAMSTYSLINPEYNPEKAWETFEYVMNKPTDSAASGTALATGVKTYNGKVGVDSNDSALKNAVEHFESLGKSTGVITSVPVAHATPACFVVHDTSRHDYSDIAKKMILESSVDVIMGCGHPYYDDSGKFSYDFDFEMEDIWRAVLSGKAGSDADGDSIPDYWEFIEDRSDFQQFMTGPTPSRVIGVAKARNTLQAGREGDAHADAFVVPFNEAVPTLEEMTKAAINILDENEKGFFLMVEGGAVDWTSHANQSGRMIEEEIDFNKSVKAAVEWVNTNSNWDETTIVVTADHETGYITGPGSNDTANVKDAAKLWIPLKNNGKGKMPGMEWHSCKHTNSLIPLYAKGKHADKFAKYAVKKDPVRGAYLDNSDVGKFLLSITD